MFVFKKDKNLFYNINGATCSFITSSDMQERQATPPTVICFRADAVIVLIISSETIFKRNSVSTINSALFFNGTVSQVRKGNPWIKMHPNFKQSDVYKTCKQQQCVSDI